MSAGTLFGLSAANAALNTGTGLLSQGISYYLNEKAAQNADQRTRELFHDLYSPQAHVKQLQDAGLSAGLMYAKGGVGGSASAGAQAAPATNQIGNVFDLMQAKLLDAQIKNINADTSKKLGESKQIDQSIINMLTDNKLTESKIAYQNLINILTDYEIKFKDATLETDIEQRKTELAKMVEEYRTAIANAGSAEIRLQIEDATANAKIKQELQKVLMNDLQIQAQKMNLKLTEKQIEMLQQNIIEKHLTNAWIDIKNETDIAKIKNDIQMEIEKLGLAKDQQTYDMCMGVVDRFIDIIKPFGKK